MLWESSLIDIFNTQEKLNDLEKKLMSFPACLFFLVVVLINNIVLWNQPRNLKNIKYSFSKHSLQRKMNKTCTCYLDVGSAWDSMKQLPFCL